MRLRLIRLQHRSQVLRLVSVIIVVTGVVCFAVGEVENGGARPSHLRAAGGICLLLVGLAMAFGNARRPD